MFNAFLEFDVLTPKQKLFALLDVAEQVLEHDVKIKGKTLDDAEMQDADVEDEFEALRSALHKLQQKVTSTVD